MFFNIYANRNYNDAEIYNGIRNNPELNSFFSSFSEYYNKMSDTIKSEEVKKLEESTPSLNEVNNLLSRIKESGITISDETYLISAIPKSSMSRLHISLPFSLVKFNDISFSEEEFRFFQFFGPNFTCVPTSLENDYKDWKKHKRNVEKEIEKLRKKIIKNNNDAKQFISDKNRLHDLTNRVERGERLKEKIEFIQNLIPEQRSLLGELYTLTKRIEWEYIQFNKLKNNMLKETEKKVKNNINSVYDEFINNRLVAIDIDLIIEKLFRVILICTLKEFKMKYMGQESTNSDVQDDDIKSEVVEWFVNQNSEKFMEKFSLAFEDSEFVADTLNNKQKKKNSYVKK